MPQNINLNVSPYYDDFNEDKDYHRVLFKPGKPIQARELTTLQSILQNQIERFGSHFFKDGSMIIPGNIGYDSNYTCVEVDSTHLGIPVMEYLQNLVGKTIRGETSNVVAKIKNVIDENISERSNNTLYIKYQSSSQSDFTTTQFQDGENLIIQEDVEYSLGVLRQNSTIATTLSNNSNSIGSAVRISEGVYYIRGFFLKINEQTLILDQYENTPSYRVGLLIKESFASASNEFSDLLDNSQGFYNFASSGADRLLIQTELFKKPLDNFEDENFVQLLKVENGEITSITKNSNYNQLLKEFARRTYDESGDYYVRPFDIDVKESLNNYLGNNGVYEESQTTLNGNIPSKDLACISIGPGKAYVRGYEIETIRDTFIDLPKTRTTNTLENQIIPFNFGTQIELNNVYGTIPVGFSTNSQVNLYNRRTKTVGVATGTQIGVARVYDIKLKSEAYVDASSVFEASLYDIQTYTNLTISTGFSTSYDKSTYIEGKFSGANGHLVDDINTTTTNFNLYQVSGSFVVNEPLIVNGTESNRIVKEVNDYKLDNLFQLTAKTPSNFTADVVLSKKIDYSNNDGNYTITQRTSSTGISTITTSNDRFIRKIKVGDVIKYSIPGNSLPTYNVVSQVGISSVVIQPLSSVTNVNDGNLPSSQITVNNLKKVTLDLVKKDSKLFSKLNNEYIASVDLTNSNITLRKTLDVINITSKDVFEVSVFEGSSDSFLVPFDEEAYTLVYADGTVEPLSSQKLRPNLDSSNNTTQGLITLRNLSKNGNAYLTITYEKINCKPRNKIYNRGVSLNINRTNSIQNTNGTGLTYSKVYGRRIEDKIISLNVPEVVSILGIFESSNDSNPILPFLTVSSINGNINDIIKGENIIGAESKAVATAISNDSTSKINICYLNNKLFEIGETITFEESGITAVVASINLGSRNITDSYILDTGSRKSYYDFSRIIRKDTASTPTKGIRILFNSYSIDSNDSGTFVNVNSYNPDLYERLPFLNGVRVSDILDFRPRVASYNTSSTISPFDFNSRVFSETNSSSSSIIAKDSSILISYDYYLPRIDKLFLNKSGEFKLLSGIPSVFPTEPDNLDKSLEIATFYLPPYITNVNKIDIETKSHKRYTMNDISLLEDRVSNVEYYTSLSLLENKTQNLEVIDKNTNLNRFKSGFFVDDFSDKNGGAVKNKLYRASIDTNQELLTPTKNSEFVDLELNIGQSVNVKKVGNSLLLNFDEIEYLKNTFATRYEFINPFNNSNWIGNIILTPSIDIPKQEDNEVENDSSVEDVYSNVEVSTENEESQDKKTKKKKNNDSNRTKKNIRSRNIGIYANSLKPNTLFYSFFDNVDVKFYVVPKLVEIEMISGSFNIGEVVKGTHSTKSNIVFRLAAQNHKFGPHNSPSETYEINPYENNLSIPSNYSPTSTILNVDIESLSSGVDSDYYGNISKGMVLRGETSGAIAKVKNVRIVTNENGIFIGSFYIPEDDEEVNPKFKKGIKTFNLTTIANNSNKLSSLDSYAEATFRVSDFVEFTKGNDLNAKNKNKKSSNKSEAFTKTRKLNSNQFNPLAQTFEISDNSGVFITKCDIYFRSKSNNIPITLDIRTTENGIPSENILSSSSVTLNSKNIQTSDTSLIPTTFTFTTPIFLEANEEYCLVLTTPSDDYSVWISRMGDEDINTLNLNKGGRNIVSQQPNLGSLFKSNNTSLWEPNLSDTLKFTLYRAEFTSSTGSVYFQNPSRNNNLNLNQVKKLEPKTIEAYSRSLYVELNNNLSNSNINALLSGDILTQTSNANFKAVVKNVLGSLKTGESLNLVNVGSGYTNGIRTYNDVDLIPITGNGIGGKINLGVGTGVAFSATISNGGSGYSVGDVLTIDYRDTNNLGENIILTVQNAVGIITNSNSIIIDEVQGALDTSNDLIIGNTTLTGIYPSQTPEVLNRGLYLKINLKNHGMHGENDLVKISSVQSDYSPTKLSVDITQSSTSILVEDATDFITFEGRTVGVSSVGCLIINDEIIEYNGVNTSTSPNTITVNTNGRGIDNTLPTSHNSGDFIFKYEFNGISLRKINKTHFIDYEDYSPTLDSFYIKVDNDSNKYFNKTKTSTNYLPVKGKINYPRSTYNISFNILKPITNILTPELSRVNAKCRTYTFKSINGTEAPYVNKGYQDCSLTNDTYFDTMRAIYSKVNENNYILDSDKSFELKLDLKTSNSKVSPIIDLDTVGVILSSNRINSPIENWENDSRVKSLLDDPNAAIYISKRVDLKNPADSLKVIFDAYRHNTNEFRVAYRLFREDVPDEYQVYELFPGYKNLDNNNEVINFNKNNGLSDQFISKSENSEDYKEYEYSIDASYLFNGFQIKLIMTGTDQANVPKIKNLRVIATR